METDSWVRQISETLGLNWSRLRFREFGGLGKRLCGEGAYLNSQEEEVRLNDDKDITETRQRIGQFIIQVYHHKRPHSALGYLTPMEFQRPTLS